MGLRPGPRGRPILLQYCYMVTEQDPLWVMKGHVVPKTSYYNHQSQWVGYRGKCYIEEDDCLEIPPLTTMSVSRRRQFSTTLFVGSFCLVNCAVSKDPAFSARRRSPYVRNLYAIHT